MTQEIKNLHLLAGLVRCQPCGTEITATHDPDNRYVCPTLMKHGPEHGPDDCTTIRNVESLPVLDLHALREEQLRTSESIFNELRDMELKPAFIADVDPNRALLDRRVLCDLLDFDDDVYDGVRRLSAKWCAEPSVHGGKARPKSALAAI